VATGYNVYVYADGDNRAASRAGLYQINGAGITTTSVSLTDAPNTNFSGTFTQANNSNGNYVPFLPSTPLPSRFPLFQHSSDGTQRAPVNASKSYPLGQLRLFAFRCASQPNSQPGHQHHLHDQCRCLERLHRLGELNGQRLPTGATASFNPPAITPGTAPR